jgi:hypothetical protein
MKNKISLSVSVLLASFILQSTFAQQKLAQSGFQFLSVVSDARGASMAEAMTSIGTGSSALFFNPATMAEMSSNFDLTASTNKWIFDMKHTTFTAAFKPSDGRYGVIGLSAQIVDYGDFYGTVVDQASPQGYDDTGIFQLHAYAFGIGYAKQLTDRFSVGGQIKWVHQDLGLSTIPIVIGSDTSKESVSNKLSPLVFDFGTVFHTGIKSLTFGMSARNFSTEVKYAQEGMQAPLVFTLGISMNVMDLMSKLPFDQSLLVSLDACHYLDHPEQVKVGLEYKAMNMISLRGGYESSSDYGDGLSFGVGITKYGFTIDYSYTPFSYYTSNIQRFTVRFTL